MAIQTKHKPLSRSEVATVVMATTRLLAELRTAINDLPIPTRNAASMARRFKVDRNICQRLLVAIRETTITGRVLQMLPGVESLHALLTAMGRAVETPAQLASAHAALKQFSNLIEELGGSQAALSRRLDASTPDAEVSLASVDELIDSRFQLFRHGTRVCGQRLAAHVLILLVREAPASAGTQIEVEAITSYVDRLARPGAMPLVAHFSLLNEGEDPVDFGKLPVGRASGASAFIIEELSTPGLQTATRHHRSGVVTVVDPDQPGGSPTTVAIGTSVSAYTHPRLESVPVASFTACVRYPTERLIVDVYVERALATSSVASLKAYQPNPSRKSNAEAFWFDELPLETRLSIIGNSDLSRACDAWNHHVAATDMLFKNWNADRDQFVGYRCDLAYPYWGSEVTCSLDFAQPHRSET